MIFDVLIAQCIIFQRALELLNFELCGQIYNQFTEECAEYIDTGSRLEHWTLRKKLVLIGPLKNCDSWCVDSSMSYLSNSF